MTLRILQDASERPDLFEWTGPIDPEKLGDWAEARGIAVGSDLFVLLSLTGGGDVFESETILCPFAGQATGDNADDANEFHRKRGLPSQYWLFHIGLVLSAVSQIDGTLVTLTRDYAVEASYDTVDAWYLRVLRQEYAERYGLTSAPSA